MIPFKGRLGVAATRLSRKRPREITERSERPRFVRIAARCGHGTRNSAEFLDSLDLSAGRGRVPVIVQIAH